MTVLLSSFSLSCVPRGYTGAVEPIAVAWSPFEHGTLLWIAEDRDFFRNNGLDVTLRKYDTGFGSLEGMLKGDADITVGVTEFPMVGRAFQKTNGRIIGAISKVEQQYLVGRRDRGIEKVSDLKGKRVGTTFRTVAEFYLGRFLELNGMNMEDITVVDLRTPAEWENAVADGAVDAIVTAQPYADLARKRLGDNAIVWPAQGGQHIFGLIVIPEGRIKETPELVDRFLKAIVQAEEYAVRNPAQSRAIMQKWLNVDAAFAESAWARDQFYLSLDQSLIVAMEDQGRWMIKNNLTGEQQLPDFNAYVYEDALEKIKPEAVNIIR